MKKWLVGGNRTDLVGRLNDKKGGKRKKGEDEELNSTGGRCRFEFNDAEKEAEKSAKICFGGTCVGGGVLPKSDYYYYCCAVLTCKKPKRVSGV